VNNTVAAVDGVEVAPYIAPKTMMTKRLSGSSAANAVNVSLLEVGMLQAGDKAPDFNLPDSDMSMSDSTDLVGKPYVIYFYPKDDTPGCTMEGLEFTELMNEFEELGVTVIGVSKDTCVSHAAFRDKYGLNIQLLADVEGQLCEAYGVWREKEKNGEKKMGIVRSTFIVDAQGTIRHAIHDVKPKGHAEQVLGLARTM
jgi:peroxiredoxin